MVPPVITAVCELLGLCPNQPVMIGGIYRRAEMQRWLLLCMVEDLLCSQSEDEALAALKELEHGLDIATKLITAHLEFAHLN